MPATRNPQDLIERREVRLRVPQGDYLLVADVAGHRILIRRDGNDGSEELAALPLAEDADPVAFFRVLGQALRAARRDGLRTDPGPLERFQPPDPRKPPDHR
ncbi:MAG TPA: hypothetical protein VKZ49_12595 [Polyangiaceae bacterium]|nr:hypothetical protein [Polyangiaceae bacterium]